MDDRTTGRTLSEDDGLLTLLRLSHALIVSVKDPPPGVWTLRVSSGAGSQSTLRVTGLSPLGFTHGFSRAPTRQLADTQQRPISGLSTIIIRNYQLFYQLFRRKTQYNDKRPRSQNAMHCTSVSNTKYSFKVFKYRFKYLLIMISVVKY